VGVRVDPQAESPASQSQARFTRICLALAFVMVVILAIRLAKRPATIEGVVVFNRQGRGHFDDVEFQTSELPPVGGVHSSLFQNCGIYRSPVETGMAVHSLEHGAVWITYDPELAAADVAYLETTVRDREYFLLSPYPGQPSPVILTAWGAQLEISSVHDERMDQFFARYLLGARTPERGASCDGGIGTPVP
jgi:hypothetical protein